MFVLDISLLLHGLQGYWTFLSAQDLKRLQIKQRPSAFRPWSARVPSTERATPSHKHEKYASSYLICYLVYNCDLFIWPELRSATLLYFMFRCSCFKCIYSQTTTQKPREHGITPKHPAEEKAARGVRCWRYPAWL